MEIICISGRQRVSHFGHRYCTLQIVHRCEKVNLHILEGIVASYLLANMCSSDVNSLRDISKYLKNKHEIKKNKQTNI